MCMPRRTSSNFLPVMHAHSPPFDSHVYRSAQHLSHYISMSFTAMVFLLCLFKHVGFSIQLCFLGNCIHFHWMFFSTSCTMLCNFAASAAASPSTSTCTSPSSSEYGASMTDRSGSLSGS
mmetsp:Transcript_95872/g.165245  ORF Transcript_95872/g.165245 Transcript_95872/m.165245 type:complete len:120 (+) Transcript_95872:201-560(+)